MEDSPTQVTTSVAEYGEWTKISDLVSTPQSKPLIYGLEAFGALDLSRFDPMATRSATPSPIEPTLLCRLGVTLVWQEVTLEDGSTQWGVIRDIDRGLVIREQESTAQDPLGQFGFVAYTAAFTAKQLLSQDAARSTVVPVGSYGMQISTEQALDLVRDGLISKAEFAEKWSSGPTDEGEPTEDVTNAGRLERIPYRWTDGVRWDEPAPQWDE